MFLEIQIIPPLKSKKSTQKSKISSLEKFKNLKRKTGNIFRKINEEGRKIYYLRSNVSESKNEGNN